MKALINIFEKLSGSPMRVALKELDREVTAAQLQNKVYNLCQFLINKKTKDRIGIALPRGIDAAMAIYSAVLLGICYVPLDLTNPKKRLKFILDNAQIKYLIGIGAKPTWCKNDLEWIDINSIDLDQPSKNIEVSYTQHSSDLLATILYTSGSTGNAKGVAISRYAIESFVVWVGNAFNIKPTDRIASLAPFYFDLSIFDLFTSIYFGATIVFVPQQHTLIPLNLSQWMQTNQISVWYTVPSLLVYWSLKGGIQEFNFNVLRLILFAGEKFPASHLLHLIALLPNTDFYNLYGPTESNVCCYWKVNQANLQKGHDIPIGYPTNYAEIKLNADGELLVKGATIASGYISSSNQLIPLTDEDGWYHTGDQCSINEMKEYVFHNRIDRMLKCYGYRIEPGEIENVAYKFLGLRECVVIGIQDGCNNLQPALFFSAENNKDLFKLHQFKKFLHDNLATYMYPAKIIQLDYLPKLPNGKIDLVGMRKMPQ